MRKLALLSVWFLSTPLVLIYFLYLFAQTSSVTEFDSLLHFKARNLVKEPPYTLFSSLPRTATDIKTAIKTGDARPVIVRDFLRLYHSPLEPYANFIVEVSDKYGFDFRLLPAIAMAESGAGKEIPDDSYNAWGYGVYGDQVLGFTSWEEGIERVAKSLKEDYISYGLKTPEEMMPKYAPPSLDKGGPWAKAVQYFIDQMR